MSLPAAMPKGFTPERRYYAFSRFLKERFGTKVYRVTIDAGFTCPNVDGTVAVGGCVYCDNRSFSPNRRLPRTTIREQVTRGVTILQERYGADRFLGAGTSKFSTTCRLRARHEQNRATPTPFASTDDITALLRMTEAPM